MNIGYKFDKEGIASDILENAGGGLILLLFTGGFFIIFFASLRSSLRDRILSGYDKFLGSFFTESLEVVLLVFQFSIAVVLG